ncbi:MAG: GntR family transcriptional regulator [Rhodospirillales bacterium]
MYQKVATELTGRIANEIYPVGSTLPTEIEICQEFEISRHTVREALRMLSAAGLISRRQKAGTRVIARTPPARFAESLSSLDDILRYSNRTRAKLVKRGVSVADDLLSKLLDSPSGERWLTLESVRRELQTDRAIGYTRTYLNVVLEPHLDKIAASETSRFAIVEEVLGLTIERVTQDTSATSVPGDIAEHLGIRHASPALQIVRRYYDANDRLLMASVNVHPADQFSYSIEMRRTEGHLPPSPIS